MFQSANTMVFPFQSLLEVTSAASGASAFVEAVNSRDLDATSTGNISIGIDRELEEGCCPDLDCAPRSKSCCGLG